MMGVIADHRLDILQAGGLGRVGLERRRCLVRILRGEHRRIEHGLRQRPRHLRLLAHQAAAQSDDAAGLVLVFAVEIGGHFLVGRVLEPEIGDRVRGQERLDFTLLDGELQQIAGIDTPVDVLDRVDALLGELDREKVLVGATEIADADDLALEIGELVEPELARDRTRMQPPWVPAAILTSNPCSSGFSQRSAMPRPASDLPVAIASSNWSVEPL